MPLNYEVMRDAEDCETAGPQLSTRPIVQQKVKYEQPMLGGGHPQGTPNVAEFMTYQLR